MSQFVGTWANGQLQAGGSWQLADGSAYTGGMFFGFFLAVGAKSVSEWGTIKMCKLIGVPLNTLG